MPDTTPPPIVQQQLDEIAAQAERHTDEVRRIQQAAAAGREELRAFTAAKLAQVKSDIARLADGDPGS